MTLGSTLPICPMPASGESLAGYLARVMILNGYCAPLPWNGWFHVEQTFPVSIRALGLDVDAVKNLIGVLPARQQATMPMHMRATDLNRYRSRWCPHCLREHGRYLGTWNLKLFAVCPIHQTFLLDRCGVCNSVVPLSRIGFMHCQCGASLADASAPRASPPLVWLAQCLTLALQGKEENNSEQFVQLRIDDWLRLLRFLGPFGTKLRPSRPGQLANAHDLAVASEIQTGGSLLLHDWPAGFHDLLSKLMHSGPPDGSLQRTFGPLYRVIYHDLASSQFQFLRDAFENFLAQHWWGLLCRRNRRLRTELVGSSKRRTLAEACVEAGTTPSQLDWLIETGQVDAARFQTVRGRRLTAVSSDDLCTAACAVEGLLDLRSASRELGLSRQRVRGLIAACIVPATRRSSTTPWMIKRVDLVGLLERCYAAPTIENRVGVALGAVLKHWHLSDGTCIALIRAMVDGHLPIMPFQETTRLADLKVDRIALREWCDRESPE